MIFNFSALNDIVISSLGLFIAVCFYNSRGETMFSYSEMCSIWAFVFHFAQKMSAFVIGMLSITRTISLVFPLTRVRKKLVLGIVGAYAAYTLSYETLMTGLPRSILSDSFVSFRFVSFRFVSV